MKHTYYVYTIDGKMYAARFGSKEMIPFVKHEINLKVQDLKERFKVVDESIEGINAMIYCTIKGI